MKNIFCSLFILLLQNLYAQNISGKEILQKVDQNMLSNSQIAVSSMTIHGRRTSRTLRLKTWIQGEDKSFSEYLSPPREAGTKMLKLKNKLWIYEPDSDRSIQISGHMLRQSVMGSDLSYEDMMEEDELNTMYHVTIIDTTILQKRSCWILFLEAKDETVSYPQRKLWVDQTRFLVMQEERFAKSGKLLKSIKVNDVWKIDNRWYPRKMVFKDELKAGKGTVFELEEIEFNVEIPAIKFTKASLRK